MKIYDMFPTRFVSAADAEKVKGEPLVIKAVVREQGINPRSKKESDIYVVYFMGAKKGVRIRKSQAPLLTQYLGENTDDWVGKEVTLYWVATPVGNGARILPKGAPTAAETKRQLAGGRSAGNDPQ